MSSYFHLVAIVLVIVLFVGLYRVVIGPTMADRMLASQLFGTAGVALLLVLAAAEKQSSLLNTALVLALLTPITLVSFIKLAEKK